MAGRGSTTQKERFGRTFLVAAAGAAGYRIWWPTDDEDRVDAQVRDGGITVDFQLKATSSPMVRADHLIFDLDVATYNELAGVRNSPGYVLLSVLPKREWLRMGADGTTVLGCTYYFEIGRRPPSVNRATARIKIPMRNRLTESALVDIMNDARRRVEA